MVQLLICSFSAALSPPVAVRRQCCFVGGSDGRHVAEVLVVRHQVRAGNCCPACEEGAALLRVKHFRIPLGLGCLLVVPENLGY